MTDPKRPPPTIDLEPNPPADENAWRRVRGVPQDVHPPVMVAAAFVARAAARGFERRAGRAPGGRDPVVGRIDA